MTSSIIGESMQVDMIRECIGFLWGFSRIVLLKIRVIAIGVFLVSINLVHNSKFLDLSKVQVLIINISDLTFNSVKLAIDIRVKRLINLVISSSI